MSSKRATNPKKQTDPTVRLAENVNAMHHNHQKVVADKTRPSLPYPTLPNGKPNPKYEDATTEYPTLPGQEYGVYSFVSPENIIKQREFYTFERFVRQWNFTSSVSAYAGFMQFISHKYKINIDMLQADLKEFVVSEAEELRRFNISDDYSYFVESNFDSLEKEYKAVYGFETSVRAFVHHGSYPTNEKASDAAEKLRKNSQHHTISVCKHGHWTPFDPHMYQVKNINYLNPELNQLMHEKQANEDKAKEEFDRRVYEAKKAAIQENVENAKRNGTTISQIMDENGNLINTRRDPTYLATQAAAAAQAEEDESTPV